MRPLIGLMLLLMLSAGCTRTAQPLTPPDIHYGQDTCARCTMIIDEPRCAAALKPTDGDLLLFDDISEMLIWRQQNANVATSAMWVHDFDSGEWFDAACATYIVGTHFTTPMGGGILAASSTERGLAVATRRGGRVTDLEDATRSTSPNQPKERKDK